MMNFIGLISEVGNVDTVKEVIDGAGNAYVGPILIAILDVIGTLAISIGFIALLIYIFKFNKEQEATSDVVVPIVITLVVMSVGSAISLIGRKFFPITGSNNEVSTVVNGIRILNDNYIKPIIMSIIGFVGIIGMAYSLIVIAIQIFKFFKEDRESRTFTFANIGKTLVILGVSAGATTLAAVFGVI